MTNKIIIDGVDVSECDHYTDGECYFNYFDGISEGRCTDFKNCDHKQLQRKIKQNDELTKIIQERNEEIKNLNYTLYEDRELTTDLVKANLKISKLERTLSSVTNKFKYDWQNKTAECEELKKKERKLYKFLKEPCNWGHNDVWIRNYLLHYLFKEREHTACTADILKDKLKIATEALKNLSFLDCEHCPKAINKQCYSSDDCKDVYRSYAQQALEQIESEEQ